MKRDDIIRMARERGLLEMDYDRVEGVADLRLLPSVRRAPRDDRNPPNNMRRRCSKCSQNRPVLGGRTHKVTRLWRCAECMKELKQ